MRPVAVSDRNAEEPFNTDAVRKHHEIRLSEGSGAVWLGLAQSVEEDSTE